MVYCAFPSALRTPVANTGKRAVESAEATDTILFLGARKPKSLYGEVRLSYSLLTETPRTTHHILRTS